MIYVRDAGPDARHPVIYARDAVIYVGDREFYLRGAERPAPDSPS